MEKTCSKCGKTKPLAEFHKHKGNRDGHSYTCKECQHIRDRERYAANKDQAKARSRAWARANPERAAARSRAWAKANPERAAANGRAWYEANKDWVAARNKARREANPEREAARRRAWREANKDREAARVMDCGLRRRYGISLAEYDEMLEAQGGSCAICGMPPEENGKRLAVDHDHETGQIRGLLCNTCNPGLGYFMHDPELLYNAISYLEQWIEQEA